MNHPLVLFDFDGTLADSFHLFLDAWTHAAQRHRFRAVDTTDLDRLRRMSARDIVAEGACRCGSCRRWWRPCARMCASGRTR
jgi:phosphoglycolate phosphatase-like HAD superfamily hydrolase